MSNEALTDWKLDNRIIVKINSSMESVKQIVRETIQSVLEGFEGANFTVQTKEEREMIYALVDPVEATDSEKLKNEIEERLKAVMDGLSVAADVFITGERYGRRIVPEDVPDGNLGGPGCCCGSDEYFQRFLEEVEDPANW